VIWKAAKEEGVEEDVAVGWDEGSHLCIERWDIAVAEHRMIQELETFLKRRGSETAKQSLFDELIGVVCVRVDCSCEVGDGVDDL